MGNLLDKLHNDHVNFIKLLTFIERQLNCIKECEVVDIEKILFSVKYMKDYPDAIHHPLENIVFTYFLEHYDYCCDEIIELMQEHEEMPLLTETVINMLQCVLSEQPIGRKELCDKLSIYIEIQKAHMNHEESKIYPVLYEIMKDEDWQGLDKTLNVSNDPLFDVPRNEDFQSLYETITAAM